jgi:hypothetical protein
MRASFLGEQSAYPSDSDSLVRAGRLELPRPFGQQILSLPRLPFRHARRAARIYYKARHPVNAPLLAQEFRPSACRGGS